MKLIAIMFVLAGVAACSDEPEITCSGEQFPAPTYIVDPDFFDTVHLYLDFGSGIETTGTIQAALVAVRADDDGCAVLDGDTTASLGGSTVGPTTLGGWTCGFEGHRGCTGATFDLFVPPALPDDTQLLFARASAAVSVSLLDTLTERMAIAVDNPTFAFHPRSVAKFRWSQPSDFAEMPQITVGTIPTDPDVSFHDCQHETADTFSCVVEGRAPFEGVLDIRVVYSVFRPGSPNTYYGIAHTVRHSFSIVP